MVLLWKCDNIDMVVLRVAFKGPLVDQNQECTFNSYHDSLAPVLIYFLVTNQINYMRELEIIRLEPLTATQAPTVSTIEMAAQSESYNIY